MAGRVVRMPSTKSRLAFFERVKSRASECDCWFWMGPFLPNGEPLFNWYGSQRSAAAFAVKLHRGYPRQGYKWVAGKPTCGVKMCVNPTHRVPVEVRKEVSREYSEIQKAAQRERNRKHYWEVVKPRRQREMEERHRKARKLNEALTGGQDGLEQQTQEG